MFFLCLLGMTALVFGGEYEGIVRHAAAVLGGGLLAGSMRPRGGKRGTARRRKMRNR